MLILLDNKLPVAPHKNKSEQTNATDGKMHLKKNQTVWQAFENLWCNLAALSDPPLGG